MLAGHAPDRSKRKDTVRHLQPLCFEIANVLNILRVLVHYGKAPIHIPAMGGIKEEFKVLPHSPYLSDLAPSDYHLFKKY